MESIERRSWQEKSSSRAMIPSERCVIRSPLGVLCIDRRLSYVERVYEQEKICFVHQAVNVRFNDLAPQSSEMEMTPRFAACAYLGGDAMLTKGFFGTCVQSNRLERRR